MEGKTRGNVKKEDGEEQEEGKTSHIHDVKNGSCGTISTAGDMSG